MTLHIHTQGRFNNHTLQDHGHGTSIMDAMKMGNTVPRLGLKTTSLAFRASVLPFSPRSLPDVTTMPTPSCVCSSLVTSEVNADYKEHPPTNQVMGSKIYHSSMP